MKGWMDRWMDGFMDRWMGGSKDERIIGSVIVTTPLGRVKMAVGRLVGVQKSHERPQHGRLGQRRRQQKSEEQQPWRSEVSRRQCFQWWGPGV